MLLWDDLVSTALLGTEHQKLASLETEGRLATLLHTLEAANENTRSVEGVLLGAAATVALHRQAGQMPLHQLTDMPEPAQPDLLPVIDKLTPVLVNQLLEDTPHILLPRWLLAVAQSGKRLPEMLLPTFLDYARNSYYIRDLLIAVLGNRGRWLAAQNPEWAFAKGSAASETQAEKLKEMFETGSIEDRTMAIKLLRRLDPKLGRELVQSTWTTDAYQQKVAFLQEFDVGLSIDDEPLLEEKALADKRKEVRMWAAKLLAGISESRFLNRMIARVSPLIRLKGLLQKTLDVSFLQECDQAMVRDGIDAKFTIEGGGEKQSWLYQMISLIPPEIWEKQLQSTPQALLGAIEKGEPYAVAVAQGWKAAAILHKNQSWAEALIASPLIGSDRQLLELLPAPQQEKCVLQLINGNKGKLYASGIGPQPLLNVLNSMTHEWSETFARTIIDALAKELPHSDHVAPVIVQSTIVQLAFSIPLSMVSAAEAVLSSVAPDLAGLQSAINRFHTVAHFRQEIFGILAQ